MSGPAEKPDAGWVPDDEPPRRDGPTDGDAAADEQPRRGVNRLLLAGLGVAVLAVLVDALAFGGAIFDSAAWRYTLWVLIGLSGMVAGAAYVKHKGK
jgi:uncharacterized membrane protein YdbT with pleckstrin-like domain